MRVITDLQRPIGDLLKEAGGDGFLVEAGDRTQYAIIPLDDDLVDYLLERSPKLIKECKRIRAEMKRGKFKTHEEVKRMFAKG
jgi:threonyl-tRNA synthetase